MTGFLTDTLVWTGALIALVLLVRRPVAKWFGAKAAYALWALPMARLLLPPLVLPSWMAPAADAPAPVEAAGAMALAPSEMPPAALASSAPGKEFALPFDLGALLIAVWLVGAALFLVRRYSLYFRMRKDLLAAARPVGRAGAVRLVETPAADGPVALGVLDQVVALPMGFMAERDLEARDLALAHELAHHRGRDLLCNMLVQPLFALHWFNPLSAMGWQALRRDQEAACDARVVGAASRERRAAYAAVIARFATRVPAAPHLALAAPMACPVLGDRSIVHRLRSISMPDLSLRRRWAGRLVLATSVLALPLTASISYAQTDAPAPPPAPVAPAAPVPAAAPVPPAPATLSTEAGSEAGAADKRHRVIRIERHIGDEGSGKDGKREVKQIVIKAPEGMSAQERAEFEKEMAEMHRELAREDMVIHRELERELGKDGKVRREVRIAVADAHSGAPRVRVECRDGQREVSETVKGKDGREEMWVCQARALDEARRGLAEARAEIRRDRDMSERQRAEAIRAIDEAEKSLRGH